MVSGVAAAAAVDIVIIQGLRVTEDLKCRHRDDNIFMCLFFPNKLLSLVVQYPFTLWLFRVDLSAATFSTLSVNPQQKLPTTYRKQGVCRKSDNATPFWELEAKPGRQEDWG